MKGLYRRLMENQSGSVMLEYVVVLAAFSVTLALFSLSIYSTDTGFGILGRAIVDNFQRIMAGVSLPTP